MTKAAKLKEDSQPISRSIHNSLCDMVILHFLKINNWNCAGCVFEVLNARRSSNGMQIVNNMVQINECGYKTHNLICIGVNLFFF